MKKLLYLSLAFICLSSPTFGETYILDLEKSIGIAKEKSYDMLNLKQNLKIAEFNLKSVTSRFKTHVNLDLTSPEYTDRINKFVDTAGISYSPVRLLSYEGALTIKQPLPTDGNISIISGMNNYDDFIRDKRSLNMSTQLQLTQPLNSLYGYNSIKSSLKQAQLGYELSSKQLKRAELNLVYNVTYTFFNLLSVQKREEIAKLNLERQKEAYSIAKNKYDAGLIKEVEALQMEVDLSEAQNNYDMSIIDQSSAMNQLKELIGIEFKDSIVLSSAMDYKVILINAEKALQLAMENRLEIREQEIQIEQNKINIKRQKAEGMIKGDLVASLGLSGISEQNRHSALSESVNYAYDNLMDGRKSFGVGFRVSIPIIDWGENRALVNAAKAQLQQSIYSQEETKRSIEREIRDLVANLNSSLKRLQLLEKSVLVAEKSFDITRQRFSDGDIDSQSLALERERLNTSYTSHLSAYITYELMLADLMRKTFYDFQRESLIQ